MNFSKRMGLVDRQSVFRLRDREFLVWCGSIVQGEDGRFTLYFSFWPADKGHSAWITHSKIGFAVSESPLGPFTYQGIALSGAGGDAWDRDCVHNPAAIKINGVYYLYYMGNFGNGEYWDHRNHQRVGVAWSERPEGPFRRLDAPVIDVTPGSFDALMTSNPTVCIGGDGRIHMVYKGVSDQGEMPKGGAVVCGAAVADHPLGPFTKGKQPVFTNPEHPWSVEDPFIWYEKGRFYALVKDFQGYFTHTDPGDAALFHSLDGFAWEPAACPLAFRRQLCWTDGEATPLLNMERPQMWLDESGTPRVLCCACVAESDPERRHSFNVQIPIRPWTEASEA